MICMPLLIDGSFNRRNSLAWRKAVAIVAKGAFCVPALVSEPLSATYILAATTVKGSTKNNIMQAINDFIMQVLSILCFIWQERINVALHVCLKNNSIDCNDG